MGERVIVVVKYFNWPIFDFQPYLDCLRTLSCSPIFKNYFSLRYRFYFWSKCVQSIVEVMKIFLKTRQQWQGSKPLA